MKKHLLFLLLFIAPIWAVESDASLSSSSEQEAPHDHVVEIPSDADRGSDAAECRCLEVTCRSVTIQEQPPGMGPCAWFGVQPCPTICCGMCAAIWITVFYFKTHGTPTDF